MELSQMIASQREFDTSFEKLHHWAEKITDNNLDVLSFLMLAIQGELGECSNIVKKICRGDTTLIQAKESLVEELVDTFIYFLKIIDQLDVDIDAEFRNKQTKNKEKFLRLKK